MATTLERARKIAAAVCEAAGNADEYCNFMRDGAYDDGLEVRIAHAAILFAERNANRTVTAPKLVEAA